MTKRQRIRAGARRGDGVLVAGVVAVSGVAADVVIEGHDAFVNYALIVARSILEGPWWFHLAR
jgi:hypothetical protein